MTGIADLYVLLKKPHSRQARERVLAGLRRATRTHQYDHNRFVVLSWKRTGSNLLCGILFNHPEIAMHNELFNPIDIFSYYQKTLLRNDQGDRWNALGRDLYPEAFLEHIWTAKDISGDLIKENCKAVGFKSFPDHWSESRNDPVFETKIMEDIQVKKIILFREDELAVYVSMKRAEKTGFYMTQPYPRDLKIHVDPVAFQMFIHNYRDTFGRRYKSAMWKQDTFRVSYEQLVDERNFKTEILPLLWNFLGVDNSVELKKLQETVKQANPEEDLSLAIENYGELEFCFRHTDVKYFNSVRDLGKETSDSKPTGASTPRENDKVANSTWSILLPICSRNKPRQQIETLTENHEGNELFNANRLHGLAVSSQYKERNERESHDDDWARLEQFADSLQKTSSPSQLENTECVVGIDVDDPVFHGQTVRITEMLPCQVKFVDITKKMYGRVCRIWNHLGKYAQNNFIVLLGDDIILKAEGWQAQVADKFQEMSKRTGLPFGAACVALYDESFPGFPTFPVVHRWHLDQFGTILPRQFVNQGGDPYLFELYSRFEAAEFATRCRLTNTIGGDKEARYKKYEINWKGQILRLSLMHLRDCLGDKCQAGICLDIVVPSYRMDNNDILESILRLKSSKHARIRFWLVVDNPAVSHLQKVKRLAATINRERFESEGNYYVTVLHYGENRGASFARNFGFNYSTADWILFMDDDVIPDDHLLDSYLGAIKRYPKARVFVGKTNLPVATNAWTKMLRTCNIMFFYGISKHVTFPPWGVTANLLVRGSRQNPTIQFKSVFPKTGGGEDIDLCFQYKEWHGKEANRSDPIIVGVPGATAQHPWWNGGNVCYGQINGWAWGDSLCISLWPHKSYWSFPNWIEFLFFFLPAYAMLAKTSLLSFLTTASLVIAAEHLLMTAKYYSSACLHANKSSIWYRLFVACGAGTILTFQEATRVVAHVSRGHFHCICRRVDWNDGQDPMVKLDMQLGSFLRCLVFAVIAYTYCS